MQDRREAPCRTLLDLIERKTDQMEERIQFLRQLELALRELHQLGLTFPMNDIEGKNCICHHVSEHSNPSAKS